MRHVVLESVTTVALTSALNGLSARQRATADNIANINTPNYHAKRVEFEDALAASVAAGSGQVTATTRTSTDATNLGGNNVNLDTETLSNIDTVLRVQFATRAIDGSLTSVRTTMKTA
jgi:flagellar basal-body rod protein FlgB